MIHYGDKDGQQVEPNHDDFSAWNFTTTSTKSLQLAEVADTYVAEMMAVEEKSSNSKNPPTRIDP